VLWDWVLFWGMGRVEQMFLRKESKQIEDNEAEPSFAGVVGMGIGRPFPITVFVLCHCFLITPFLSVIATCLIFTNTC